MFLLQAMASAVTAAGAVCWGGHLNVRPVLEVGLALVVCVANYDIKSAKLCTGKLRFISSTGASKMSSSRRSCLQQRYCGGRESQKLSATRNLPVKGWAFRRLRYSHDNDDQRGTAIPSGLRRNLQPQKAPLLPALYRRSCWHYLFLNSATGTSEITGGHCGHANSAQMTRNGPHQVQAIVNHRLIEAKHTRGRSIVASAQR